MAPEQARGEVEVVDERADVFGLGAILCAILTGQPPHAGADREDVLRRAAAGDLAEAFAGLDGCGADAELVALCRACLAPGREDRPRDARAVADAITGYLVGVQERLRRAELERAEARARAAAEGEARAAAQARARAERRARRLTVGLAAAVLALVLLGGGGWVWRELGRQATSQRVSGALGQAEQLAEQARNARLGNVEDFWAAVALWEQALEKVERADELAAVGPADSGLAQRREELRRNLGAEAVQARRLAKLRDDLEKAQLAGAVWGRDWFDTAAKQSRYEAALRDYGIDVRVDDVGELAKRLEQLPKAVFDPVMFALDDWAADWFGAPKAPEPALRKRLQEAARMTDRDKWRAKWRDARAEENIGHLRELAEGAAQQQLPALALRLLMMSLRERGAVSEAIALLRHGQRNHRADFWIQFELANLLYASRNRTPAQLGEAIGCYNAALILRPQTSAAYNNLGNALSDNGDHQGAIDAYRRAIAIDDNHAFAHYNLANALAVSGDVDGAIKEYKKAIELNAEIAGAHHNLANALAKGGDVDGAIEEYEKAVAIDEKNVEACYSLALALLVRKKLEKAISRFHQVIAIDKNHPGAYDHLGLALFQQGRFAEARTAIRRSLELYPERNPWRQVASQRLRQCERLAAADEKLPAVCAGEAEPADAAERIALAQLCREFKRRHVAAARFYADAFAADPRLGADLQQQHRYNAACSAALAAAGQGEDSKHLPDKVCLGLRRQALTWLRDDLAAYRTPAERTEPATKQLVHQQMQYWQRADDLASVRDPQALDRLPDDERQQWRQLWQDVAALLSKVEEKK
jgi:serine/threonine-protein kinase